MKLRSEIVPQASGDVLEVGMGSGINLAFYDKSKVNTVYGLEPSLGMRKKAQANLAKTDVNVEWLDLPGEAVPLADNSVDTVLLTFTLCSIDNWQKALEQMYRVLKPNGQLLFCEHGLSPDANVQRWQNRINPIWKAVAGGCNINRPTLDYLQTQPFTIVNSDTIYVNKTPKIAGYVTKGLAVKPA